MKTTSRLIAILALFTLAGLNPAFAQSSPPFTYQGQLTAGGTAANGVYDLSFAIYDANLGGDLIAGPITNTAVPVSNGLFTVTLNFGAGLFTGTNYWVQMAVSPTGTGTFSTLTPRQQLTPAPYAISILSPQANALCPPGSVLAYMGASVPAGWLLCDGSAVSRTTYPALFAAIGIASGQGDGSTTFNVPDMRGEFLRGVDRGAGRDPDTSVRAANNPGGNTGDTVGSMQGDAFAQHYHGTAINSPNNDASLSAWNTGTQLAANAAYTMWGSSSGSAPSQNTQEIGGSIETRPKNVYVNYIIKY